MTKALYRHSLDAEFPIAVKGDGVYLIDAEGKRYLDGSGGAAVSCLGHSNQRVRDAVKSQIDELPFAHTRFFSNEPMEALAKDLVSDAPAGLTKAWFTCGGSESIEARVRAMENGLICYPMGGLVDGKRGDNVMIAPPFIVEENHVFELIDKLNMTLEQTLP